MVSDRSLEPGQREGRRRAPKKENFVLVRRDYEGLDYKVPRD